MIRDLTYRPHPSQYTDEVFHTIDTFNHIDSIVRQRALDEAYDLASGAYRGYDLAHVSRPYAVIAYHPLEDNMSGLMFDRYLRRFTRFSVNELTGLSFKEFIHMDMESVINVLEVCKQISEKKQKDVGNAIESLEEIAK